jgi:hypothetical protein
MNLFQESNGRLSALEQLRSLITANRGPPIGQTLDFALTEVEARRAVFEGVPGRHAYNPLGVVHGGYAAALLDSACGCALCSTLNRLRFMAKPLRMTKILPKTGLTYGTNSGRSLIMATQCHLLSSPHSR